MLKKPITVAIVDDHQLFARSLATLITSFKNCEVFFIAENGFDLLEKLSVHGNPDVILLDVNMPFMNGETVLPKLKEQNCDSKVLMLSMDDDEKTILRMLKNGAKGYLLKDIHPDALKQAIFEVVEKGFYFSKNISEVLVNTLNAKKVKTPHLLKDREEEFLRLSCSELTYKEISDEMGLSIKTIDGYRQDLFKKFDVKNRIGMVLYSLKNGIIEL